MEQTNQIIPLLGLASLAVSLTLLFFRRLLSNPAFMACVTAFGWGGLTLIVGSMTGVSMANCIIGSSMITGIAAICGWFVFNK